MLAVDSLLLYREIVYSFYSKKEVLQAFFESLEPFAPILERLCDILTVKQRGLGCSSGTEYSKEILCRHVSFHSCRLAVGT